MSFQKRLSSGEFVVLAEMNTPKGVDISELVSNARRIKGRVDAVVIPDMDNGVMRMSALAGGVLMQQQGVEAIIHTYCRDRNRMALQGDLLAAHVLGIQNLVVVNGIEMTHGDHQDAATVDDLDETALLNAIQTMEGGNDMAGFALAGSPAFTTGCTLAPFSDDATLAASLDTARGHVAAGAQFIIVPPVFDTAKFGQALDRIKELGIPVIATVFLLKSVGIARYMAINEPGSYISEEMIRRIRKSPDREQECLRIAGETVAALRDMVQGVKIETLGWEHRLPEILDCAGL